MSYDISLMIDTGGDEDELVEALEIGNYTTNVGPMWCDALGGKLLREYDGVPCSEAAAPLADAVKRMEADPEKYRAMNPENRWGDYEGAMGYLRRLAEACAANPRCVIGVYA